MGGPKQILYFSRNDRLEMRDMVLLIYGVSHRSQFHITGQIFGSELYLGLIVVIKENYRRREKLGLAQKSFRFEIIRAKY